MAEIVVHKNRVSKIDECDIESASHYKWYIDHYGYAMAQTKENKSIKLHRLVANNMNIIGSIDHINGDKLDNRRCNLRAANCSQNGANRGKQKNNKSGYKGVRKVNNRWGTQIRINGKSKHVGYYATILEAARAYNLAAIKYFGEFCRFNNTCNLSSDIEVSLIQSVGSDAGIVAAARVSTIGKEAKNSSEENYGLINYLMKNRHGSVYEHNSITFFIHAPIFVIREWQRHRIQSFNEESQRYKTIEPKFWIPNTKRPIIPADDHKPSKPHFIIGKDEDYTAINTALSQVYEVAYATYENLVNSGYAKEVCRACLPIGIYSSMFVTMNIRALMHFLSLRTHDESAKFISNPQAEIEEAARKIEIIFAEHWPLTYKAFVANGRVAP